VPVRYIAYLVCLAFHFSLLLLTSSRQALSVISGGGTILPSSWNAPLANAEETATAVLGEKLSSNNPFRQVVFGYTRLAGIETGYSFFAPSVSAVRKLVFEISYPDGHTEYQLPHVGDPATGLRLMLLFENLERIPYEPLREMMFKIMAFSVWREHPTANKVRGVFGYINMPSASGFERKQQPAYEVLFIYDFFPPNQSDNQ
jgi:hypothetical protein